MAKFRKRRSGGRKMTIPVSVVAGFIPLVKGTYEHYSWFGWQGANGALDWASRAMTGYSPGKMDGKSFDFGRLKDGLLPILGGILVHQAMNRLGVNRAIARMGIPVIRV